MVRIAPVTLQNNPKTLWFDPNGLEIHDGDCVIVSTERGTEFGYADDICEVSEEAVAKLKCLKPVLRVATPEDIERAEELRQMSKDALPVFKRMAAESNEEMHPVMVEYLFDGDKAIFYFEAEDRIDFRELVRKLAAEFHIRVDMRQIGVRDEARLVGGLGHCGQELCCRRLGGEFCPVSIRMAKEQDLSLNPQKISGVCGRLMCCLRYEYEAYKEFKSRAPKVNAKIQTPKGVAKVVELDVPRERVKVRMEEDGKNVTFPLSAMDEAPEGATRPNSIGDDFLQYYDPDPFEGVITGLFDTSAFTRDDKLATPEARRSAPAKPEPAESDQKSGGRRVRRRRSKRIETASQPAGSTQEKRAGQPSGAASSSQGQAGGAKRPSQKRSDRAKQPSAKAAAAREATMAKINEASKSVAAGQEGQRAGARRRRAPRRVSNDIAIEQAQSAAKSKQRKEKVSNQKTQIQRKRAAVRPGQKSSGLQATRPDAVSTKPPKNLDKQPPVQHQHRRTRRRSHKTGGNGNES